MTRGMNFETVLPRLLASYEAGRLVPFIGSGMSRTVCTDWPTFVYRLEVAASGPGVAAPEEGAARDALIRRANNAVRALRAREPGAFERALAKALFTAPDAPPAVPSQTTALARLWWPLVLSTNYDNCYAAAFRCAFPGHRARHDRTHQRGLPAHPQFTVGGRAAAALGAARLSGRASSRTRQARRRPRFAQ